MVPLQLKRPVLIYFYGYPGSGKSYLAKNLSQQINAVLVSEEKIRNELFETPRHDNQENQIVRYVMNYLAEGFLRAGVGVIYDCNADRLGHRRNLRTTAINNKAEHLLIWVQIDPESALFRSQNRAKKSADDKSVSLPNQSFESQIAKMQNPKDEHYLVISGKHSFVTQKSAILNRLYQAGLLDSSVIQSHIAVPGLINLVPTAGRVDLNRRNIRID